MGGKLEIPGPSGGGAAALRISAGARIVSESWTCAGEGIAIRDLQREFAEIRTILDKVDLLLRNLAALAPDRAAPGAVALARAAR